jgi:hypothetical protein
MCDENQETNIVATHRFCAQEVALFDHFICVCLIPETRKTSAA